MLKVTVMALVVAPAARFVTLTSRYGMPSNVPVAFSRTAPAGRLNRMKIGPLNADVPVFVRVMLPLHKPVLKLRARPNLLIRMLAASTAKVPSGPVGKALPSKSVIGGPPNSTV